MPTLRDVRYTQRKPDSKSLFSEIVELRTHITSFREEARPVVAVGSISRPVWLRSALYRPYHQSGAWL